jgi:membrane protein required for colicin V production
MTPFDVCVLIVLTLSFLYSLFKGFIREIFALIAYVGGYAVAVKFHNDLAKTLSGTISNETVAKVAAFVIIYVATMIAVKILGNIIRKFFQEAAGLSGMDRFLGAMVGLAKGVVILVVLMVPLSYFPDFYKKAVEGSKFAPHLQAVSGTVTEALGASQDLIGNISGDMDTDMFNGLKDKLKSLEDITKLSQNGNKQPSGTDSGINLEKISQFSEEIKRASEFLGKPQEEYTKDDVEKLDKLLKSVDKYE